MNQKETVYGMVMAFVKSKEIQPTQLTREMKQQITLGLMVGFETKAIEFINSESNAAKLADKNKLRDYCSGLLNNWLRKDARLNGGVKYEPKYRRTPVSTITLNTQVSEEVASLLEIATEQKAA